MDSETFIFAYGSNLDIDRMHGRIPSTELIGRSRLAGHDLRFHVRGLLDRTAKADAFKTDDPTHAVLGVVYRIAREHLSRLDRIEGGYDRVAHTLRLDTDGPATGEEIRAWAYHGRPELLISDLLPLGSYLGYVRRGARAHRFPRSYLERLDAHPARRDPAGEVSRSLSSAEG